MVDINVDVTMRFPDVFFAWMFCSPSGDFWCVCVCVCVPKHHMVKKEKPTIRGGRQYVHKTTTCVVKKSSTQGEKALYLVCHPMEHQEKNTKHTNGSLRKRCRRSMEDADDERRGVSC